VCERLFSCYYEGSKEGIRMAGTIAEQYKSYIMSRTDPAYTIAPFTDDEGSHIGFTTPYAVASVTIHEIGTMYVVELKIVRKKDDKVVFYLHFELKDLDHAKELFDEMIASLKALKEDEKITVLLCCTSGITTSYFNSKLKEASGVLDLNYSFKAVSYNLLYMEAYAADVILLAPQIGYLKDKVQEILADKVVVRIPASIFASYDVSQLIRLVDDALADKKKTEEEKKIPAERPAFFNPSRTLVVCVLIQNKAVRIGCRVYDEGKIIYHDEMIKKTYQLSDLEDVMDVVLVRVKDIQDVIVVTPGIYHNGTLTFRQPGIINVNVDELFGERYHRPILFMNDANAMALGYYGSQKKYDSLCFYFHPISERTPGIGTIINGQLLLGSSGIAGEMQFVLKTLGISERVDELARTPEGTLEIISYYLNDLIAYLDPPAIVISCDFLTSVDELRELLQIMVRKDAVPDLIKVESAEEYMYSGGLMETASWHEHHQH
jgi:cellobiose-specific phosphotransferase system component IIB